MTGRYLPEAVINYLARLGWSHGDQEIFSKEELVKLFKLEDVNKAASAFNTEKLNWLNQHYMKTLPAEQVADALKWQFDQLGVDTSTGPALTAIVGLQADRVKTLKEMAAISRYFYEPVTEFEEKAAKKHLRPVAKEPLEAVRASLSGLTDWTAESIQEAINGTAEALGVGMGKIGMPLRVAATGGGNSPSLDVTLAQLDQQKVIERIDLALAFIAEREANA